MFDIDAIRAARIEAFKPSTKTASDPIHVDSLTQMMQDVSTRILFGGGGDKPMSQEVISELRDYFATAVARGPGDTKESMLSYLSSVASLAYLESFRGITIV